MYEQLNAIEKASAGGKSGTGLRRSESKSLKCFEDATLARRIVSAVRVPVCGEVPQD